MHLIWYRKLKYWRHNPVPHCIDFMHVEKNVAESIVGTLLHVPGKTKDGLNARLDLAELGVKPELFAMQDEDKTTLPLAGYTLTNAEKDIFCETLHNIKVIKGHMQNRNKPEGCIAEETIAEETIEFFSEYHKSMETIGIPPDKHETYENEEGKPLSAKKTSEVSAELFQKAHLRHKQVLKTENPGKRIAFLENEHSKSFAKWLREEVERELAIDKESVSETVRWISYGPRATVVKYDAYNINGYTFRTKCHDGKVYQNSGVSVEAIDLHISKEVATTRQAYYYGVLQEIWVLDYRFRQIPLFKCDWVNHKSGGVKRDKLGYTLVDLNNLGHKVDPFVLASQALQVFYVKDPVDKKLSIVFKTPPKNYKDTYDEVDEEFSTVIHHRNDNVLPLVDRRDLANESRDDYYRKDCGVVMSADSAITYTSVHSEARSWSIPSEDPYEEAARQLLEQAPLPAEDEAPTPPLPPFFLSPRIRPPHTRAAMRQMRATAPSTYHSLLLSGTPPLLPIPLPAPSTSRRADIPEADTPPRKRLLLTTPRPGCEVGESSAAAAARQPGPTIETRLRDTERRMMTALELVNRRVTYQVDVCTRESSEFCTRHHDAQKDRAAVRAEIEVLRRERLAYEQESMETRQALARSEAHCRALEARVTVLETEVHRHEWQRQAADDLAIQHIMRTQALEAGARVDTLEDTGVAAAMAVAEASRVRNGYNSNGSGPRPAQTARECSYSEFLKCKPLDFKGTEGVVGLTQWFEKMESVFSISNCTIASQVKFATCTLQDDALTWWNAHVKTTTPEAAHVMPWATLKKMTTDKYCPRGKIKKIETEMWNLKVKGTDVVAYSRRFQQLALMCSRMFPEEIDKIEKYIGGLPDMIHGSVKASKPKTMQEAIEFTTELMDEKTHAYAERQAKRKRKYDDLSKNNQNQQHLNKRQNTGQAYSAGNSGRKPYAGSKPLCSKCNCNHEGPCPPKCSNCKRVGHATKDCRIRPANNNNNRNNNNNN
ncbi:putative reverse transcriptase domain-containing protein [Tanacetum coccineum]